MSRLRELENSEVSRAAVSGLEPFSSTALATGVSAISREVLQRGAVVITKHEEPVMVLMSIERYAQLERAAAPDLRALSRQFEDLYRRMQAPDVVEKTVAALELGGGGTPPTPPARRPARRRR
ncbi:MAG: type II toxin-antitoxin system prevent-host-death family antitoxin [Thermoanaerobaculia bacterium]